MRIIHTSDWHLGQNFFNQSRKDEHQAFLDWLLRQIEEQDIDAVIVSGDIFDTGTPPSYAREMLNRFVVSVNRLGCALVLVAGNHDSVATLNESKHLMAYLNTQVISSASDNYPQQLITLKNRDGSIGAYLCAVPFLRPRDLIYSQQGQTLRDKQLALSDAIQKHYHQLYSHTVEVRAEQGNSDTPIIMTGHLSALGVTKSDSVRDIYIGTLEGFDAKGFPDADYIALGHIHRPQIVAKQEQIRYCGSPINLSFDELSQQKQILAVDFEGHSPSITPIAVPCFQPMHKLKGSLDEIKEQITNQLDSSDEQIQWLNIEVTTDAVHSDLQDRIQELLGQRPALVLQLKRSNLKNSQALSGAKSETLSELTPEEVFSKRLALEEVSEDNKQAFEERKLRIGHIFNQLCDEIHTANQEDTQP